MKLFSLFAISLSFLASLTGKTVQLGAWDESLPKKLQGASSEIVQSSKKELPIYTLAPSALATKEELATSESLLEESSSLASETVVVQEREEEKPLQSFDREIADAVEMPQEPSVQEAEVPPPPENYADSKATHTEKRAIRWQPAYPLRPFNREIAGTEKVPQETEVLPPAENYRDSKPTVIEEKAVRWQPVHPLQPSCREKFSTAPQITDEPLPCIAPLQLEEPCIEVCSPCPKRECCSPYLGYGAGAAVIGTAIAGMLIPDCKTAKDPAGPPPPPPSYQTLQFVIDSQCEFGEDQIVTIYLPGMQLFESFSINFGNYPSSVINTPSSGTYTVTIENVPSESESCYTIDVILDGNTVISGASFTGLAPTLTFTYNLP